jgi:hypothetical protein
LSLISLYIIGYRTVVLCINNREEHHFHIHISLSLSLYCSNIKEEFQLLSYNSSDIPCSCLDLEPTIGIRADYLFWNLLVSCFLILLLIWSFFSGYTLFFKIFLWRTLYLCEEDKFSHYSVFTNTKSREPHSNHIIWNPLYHIRYSHIPNPFYKFQ